MQLVRQRAIRQLLRQRHEIVGVSLIRCKLLKLRAEQLDEIWLLRSGPKVPQVGAQRLQCPREQNAHAAFI